MNDNSRIRWGDIKKLLCDECTAAIIAYREDRYMDVSNPGYYHLRDKRVRHGLCVQCGEPKDIGSMCARCRKAARLQRRKSVGCKAWRKGRPGRPPIGSKGKP